MLEVSIVIVNWNSKEFIGSCLLSIPEGDYEVIVVDNGSSDGSADFIEKRFPHTRLIRNSTNRGFAAACNQGASVARGEYIFFLNPDTILQKDSLRKLVEFARSQARLGAVGPQLIGRDGKIQNSVRRFPTMRGVLIGRKGRLVQKLSSERPSSVDQISGAAFLIKRDLWRDVGGMDERFFMFYEEVDLCRRLKDLGYNIYYLPTARITHLGGGSRHKDREAVANYYLKSMFHYFQKYESPKRFFWFRLVYRPMFLKKGFLIFFYIILVGLFLKGEVFRFHGITFTSVKNFVLVFIVWWLIMKLTGALKK